MSIRARRKPRLLAAALGPSGICAGAIALAVGLIGPSASAATFAQCGNHVSASTREFQVTVTSGGVLCLASGDGNISGNPISNDPFLDAHPQYTLLDKTDNSSDGVAGWTSAVSITGLGKSNVGETSSFGKFTITLGNSLYDHLVIAFKVGDANKSPDWAAFSLLDGALSGTFTVIPKQGSYSHANLYGILARDPGNPSEVPLPGAVLLMGSVLAGSAGLAKWRKRRSRAGVA